MNDKISRCGAKPRQAEQDFGKPTQSLMPAGRCPLISENGQPVEVSKACVKPKAQWGPGGVPGHD